MFCLDARLSPSPKPHLRVFTRVEVNRGVPRSSTAVEWTVSEGVDPNQSAVNTTYQPLLLIFFAI